MAQNVFFAKIQDGSHTCDLDMPFLGTAVRSTLQGSGVKGIELWCLVQKLNDIQHFFETKKKQQTNKQKKKKTDRGENNIVWFSEKSAYN